MHFPFYLKRMINLQGRGHNTAGNTHNPDAVSAAHCQIKHCSPQRDISAWHWYQQPDCRYSFTNPLSDRGRWNTTKSAALPLWRGWVCWSVFVWKKSCWTCWKINPISNEKYGPPPHHHMCQQVCLASCWHIAAPSEDVIKQTVETHR